MTYRITGLSPQTFAHLIGASEDVLVQAGATRVTAAADKGWPCRVSLNDAKAGESLILLNHISHDVGRPMAFRAFDAGGMLRDAALALPGQADAKIRELFENDDIAYIHAHNAAHGCFSAKVERN
jgi:hypothetical protein